MHIAFVNASSRWGGVKTWMLDFAAGLVQRGHQVEIYGRQTEFVEQARIRTGHGEQVRFGADLNPAAVRYFCRAFRKAGTEVVILNVGKDLATAGVAAKWLGIPVVQRIGLPGDIPLKLKTRLLHQWVHPAFLAPCQYIADGFATSLPYLDGFTVKVVLNGKKPSEGELAVHRPRRLVVTQQLFPDKGHAALLRALALLEKDNTCPAFELHVVGTGREEASLRALTTELGLDARVVWHGFSTTVEEHLAESDIFVLGSTSEGLPNTLLEALAAGLVPVCRDVGGVREVLPKAFWRWMQPFGAGPENFAAALREVLDLPDQELLRLRVDARTSCADQLSLSARVAELEDWLISIIRQSPAKS